MNLSDLTEELHHRADEASGPTGIGAAGGSIDRVRAVRHRIQVRRRRRVATAGAVVVCAVVTAFAGPSIDFGRERTLPADVDTTVPVPAHDGGDPLLASVVGQTGEREVVLTFTPTDLDLSLVGLCRIPEAATTSDDPEGSSPGWAVSLWSTSLSGGCDNTGPEADSWFSFDDDPATNRARWADAGLVVGRPVRIKIGILQNEDSAAGSEESVANDRFRLGLAVYQRTGKRIVAGEARLRELISSGGREYRLVEHRSATVDDGQAVLTLDAPAGDSPLLVVAGAVTEPEQVTSERDTSKLLVDGAWLAGGEGWGLSTQPLQDSRAHQLRLEVSGVTRHVTAVIAYYELVE